MSLFDSLGGFLTPITDIFENIGEAAGGLLSGDFSFENISTLAAESFAPGGSLMLDKFTSGGGFDVSNLTGLFGGAGGGGASGITPAGPGRPFQYSPARQRLQLISTLKAPQQVYRQIAAQTYGQLTAQSDGRQRCTTLVDLVDQGFPSAEIPTSVRTGCRSWLMGQTTTGQGYQPTFSPMRPSYSTYPQGQSAYPAWARQVRRY